MAKTSSKNSEWLSIHLFYANHDFLLINGVKPFIDLMKSKCYIYSYFFIRYWEKGPHIRLRLKISSNKIPEIKTLIDNYFTEFMERRHPSVRKQEFPGSCNNNSIHYIDYIPETERYGGKYALKIAEEHFENSSDTVLSLMAKSDEWSFPVGQALVIQLHILFFNAIKINLSNRVKMLSVLSENKIWKKKAQKFLVDNDNIEEIFENHFQKKRNILYGIKQEIEKLIEANTLCDYRELHSFFQSIQKTDEELKNLFKNKKTEFDSDEQTQRTRIYMSYLHMLNNRIGLKNHDEAYIVYIIYRLYKNER